MDVGPSPALPEGHRGYGLQGSADLPLEVLPELPEISIAAKATPVTEGTQTHAIFTLRRTGSTTAALDVAWTRGTEGDFLADNSGLTPTTLTFPAGAATTELSIALDDDGVEEFEGGSVAVRVEASPQDRYGIDPERGSARVRILDDELRVHVRWQIAEVTVAEGAGAVTLTAVAETPLEGPAVAVSGLIAATRSGTAESGADFTAVSVPVAFAAADYTAERGRHVARTEVSLSTIEDDDRDERDEAFEVALVGGTGLTAGVAGLAEAQAQATVTIADDDPAPVLGLSVNPIRVAEGGSGATVKVLTINGATFATAQTVTLGLEGSATETADYALASKSLTLAAGASESESTDLTVVDDTDDERDESIVIIATHGATEIGRSGLALVDNDGVANQPATGEPTISGVARVGETLTAAVSEIEDLDGLSGASYAYQWSRGDGATETDIPGATAATYTLVEADAGQRIRVRVSFTDDLMNAEVRSSAPTVAVTVVPEISIAARRSPVTEGTDSHAVFTLTRTPSTDAELIVNVTVVDEFDAMSGTPPSSVTFEAGSSSAELSVAIANNSTAGNGLEKVVATVNAGTGYSVDPDENSALVRVLDDDWRHSAHWESQQPTVAEGAGTVSATLVVRGRDATAPTDVPVLSVYVRSLTALDSGTAAVLENEEADYEYDFYETNTFGPTDFAQDADGIWIARRAFEVTIFDDAIIEGDERFNWRLAAPNVNIFLPEIDDSGGILEMPVTIRDDDAPVWDFSIVPDRVAEGETATVTASISNEVSYRQDQTVTLAFGGSASETGDYTKGASTLALAAGTRSAGSATIATVDDADTEGDETILVTAMLDGAVIGQRTLTILDDEDDSLPALPTVSIMPKSGGVQVDEGADAVFTLTLDAAPAADLTVSVQVTREGAVIAIPADYAAPVSVTFTTTETEQELTIGTSLDPGFDALPGAPETAGRITAVVQPAAGYAPDPNRAGATVTVLERHVQRNSTPALHQSGNPFGERERDGSRLGGGRRPRRCRRGVLRDHGRGGHGAVRD